MVDVEVHDRDASAAPRPGVGGCDGNVVEDAKAHGGIRSGVVTRRPQECDAETTLAGFELVDQCHGAACSTPGGIDGTRAVVRVPVEVPAVTGRVAQLLEVAATMHSSKLVIRGVPRGKG